MQNNKLDILEIDYLQNKFILFLENEEQDFYLEFDDKQLKEFIKFLKVNRKQLPKHKRKFN